MPWMPKAIVPSGISQWDGNHHFEWENHGKTMGKPWENHGKMVIYMERSTILKFGKSTISKWAMFNSEL